MSLFNTIKDEDLTQEEKQARTRSRVRKKKILRHLWNFFVSFLAGLTIVYPVVKIIQYRYIRNNEIAKKEHTYQTVTSKHKSKGVLELIGTEYKSWAMYYELGLSGKYGTEHTFSEITAAIPRQEQRISLGASRLASTHD